MLQEIISCNKYKITLEIVNLVLPRGEVVQEEELISHLFGLGRRLDEAARLSLVDRFETLESVDSRLLAANARRATRGDRTDGVGDKLTGQTGSTDEDDAAAALASHTGSAEHLLAAAASRAAAYCWCGGCCWGWWWSRLSVEEEAFLTGRSVKWPDPRTVAGQSDDQKVPNPLSRLLIESTEATEVTEGRLVMRSKAGGRLLATSIEARLGTAWMEARFRGFAGGGTAAAPAGEAGLLYYSAMLISFLFK